MLGTWNMSQGMRYSFRRHRYDFIIYNKPATVWLYYPYSELEWKRKFQESSTNSEIMHINFYLRANISLYIIHCLFHTV